MTNSSNTTTCELKNYLVYNVCINNYSFCRVFKQTLRSAGGNLTTKHVEDVSLCALFLMEASKKADHLFKVPPPSTAHTIRDSDKDIEKMVGHQSQHCRQQQDFSSIHGSSRERVDQTVDDRLDEEGTGA